MKTNALLLVALAGTVGVALAASPVEAQERAVRCVIESAQSVSYRGPCLFEAEQGGSFNVAPPSGRTFGSGITSISVALTGRGIAEVRGLTRDGINSRWGRAVRSNRDRACWVGSDFRVCAY